MDRKAEQGWSPNLNDAVKLWPTPRANDAEKRGNINADDPRNGLPGAVKLWPTPRASDGEHGGPNQRDSKGNYALSGAVHHTSLWPTPAAQDAKNATLPPSQIDRDTVPGAVMRQGQKGQLNPDWVECLMGFPIGWTDIDRDETESHWIEEPRWPAGPNEEQYEWEPPRVATGVKNRVPRLKACGNAVVPAHAYPFMAAIKAVHEGNLT
ncbi:hypothetical protein EDM54_23760 [Brevibacillus borstelensis]|nr:hypothetical protein EDM54_23760 [Brevibacillus borstelensis]